MTIDEITDTTAQLSWRPGPDNHSPITMYVIQARTPFSVGWQAVSTGTVLMLGWHLMGLLTQHRGQRPAADAEGIWVPGQAQLQVTHDCGVAWNSDNGTVGF